MVFDCDTLKNRCNSRGKCTGSMPIGDRPVYFLNELRDWVSESVRELMNG